MSSGQVSAIDNFGNTRPDLASATTRVMYLAIGIFRERMTESLNPIFWGEAIVFLPRTVLSHLGVSAEGVVAKVANLVWLVVVFIFGAIWAAYLDEINTLIRGTLNGLLTVAPKP